MIQIDARTARNLRDVHPHLRAITEYAYYVVRNHGDGSLRFVVTCGSRTFAEQKRLKAIGATRTLNSRHLIAPNGYAHAVDLAAFVNDKLRWDWPLYGILANYMRDGAVNFGYDLEWGGNWRSFKDGPHFQLPWKSYPGHKGT